jgi:uncharacterized protein
MSLASALNRRLDSMRDPRAFDAAAERGTESDLCALEGHKYALLVSFRRSGDPIPTPVWFGLKRGRAYFNTRETNSKVTRIRHDPHVRIGPCSFRGRPLGPMAEARASIVSQQDQAGAEAALRSNYGFLRRAYYATVGSRGTPTIYVEVTPEVA